VDEEEVSESQALTNLPPELLMKILSYLSTYGRNSPFWTPMSKKLDRFNHKYFFVKRSSFFGAVA